MAPAAAPDHLLFDIDQFLIRPGERVALLGANGVGKSTFIRLLTGAFRGAETNGIRLSPQVRLGYYDQELDEATSESSLVDFLIKRVDVADAQVRRRLINAGFPYRDHDKRLSVMSGGERARALFVLLSLRAPNFLILDEPTNHIDIDGKEQLEEQLLDSGAAVLITSHDRRFLDTVAQRYVLIRGKRLVEVTDPSEFYETPDDATAPRSALRDGAEPHRPQADDALARIVEIEAMLDADLARKARFQKPELQLQWRAELEQLYKRLDRD